MLLFDLSASAGKIMLNPVRQDFVILQRTADGSDFLEKFLRTGAAVQVNRFEVG